MSDLTDKLAEVMAEVGYVQKDALNDFHHYRYASAEAVLKKVNAALSERGIAVSTQAELLQYEQHPGEKGPSMHAVVRLSLAFTDGADSITAQGLGEGSDKGDKAVMKADTAALKYALANAFMISWGDDPEADIDTDKAARVTELNPFTGSDMTPIDAPLPPKGTKGINAARELYGFAEMAGWTTDELLSWVAKRTGGKKPEDVTAAQAKALLEAIKKEA